MNIYKYLGSTSSKEFLKNHTIRFSQPKAFNDPFEMQPEIWDLNNKFPKDCSITFSLTGNKIDINKYIITNFAKENDVQKIDVRKLFNDFNEKIGVLCLTRANSMVPINYLMWAHYAESHTGLVIEFKNDSAYLNDFTDVIYVNKRPVLDSSIFADNSMIGISNFFFKSNQWSYENEFRKVITLESCQSLGTFDSRQIPIYISKLDLSDVKCIYIGCNKSKELNDLAFDFHNRTNIPVIFLRVHDIGYRLVPYTALGLEISEIIPNQEKLLFNRDKF